MKDFLFLLALRDVILLLQIKAHYGGEGDFLRLSAIVFLISPLNFSFQSAFQNQMIVLIAVVSIVVE